MVLDTATLLDYTSDELSVVLTVLINSSNDSINAYMVFTESVRVDWGDDSEQTVFEKGDNTIYHEYPESIAYSVTFYSLTKSSIYSIKVIGNIYSVDGYANLWQIIYSNEDMYSIEFSDYDATSIENIKTMPQDLVSININPASYTVIRGDFSDLPESLIYFAVYKLDSIFTDTYTSGHFFSSDLTTFIMDTISMGISSTDVDNMLIDLNSSLVSNAIITFSGYTGAKTSASDTAVTALEGRGCTVTTN